MIAKNWKTFSFIFLFFKMFNCCFAVELPNQSIAEKTLSLHKKIININLALLKFQDDIIFKATKQKKVDLNRVQAKFNSCKRQSIALRRLAQMLEKYIDTANPLLPRIEALKQRMFLVKKAHKFKLAKLKNILNQNLDDFEKIVEDTTDELPEKSENYLFEDLLYPVNSVDEQF
jgi:hypothetical protein